MTFDSVYEKIKDADMVLIGLGEEFDQIKTLKENSQYITEKEQIQESGKLWMLPVCDAKYRKKMIEQENKVRNACMRLADKLQKKNYFIISVAFQDVVDQIPWREGRLVKPCGGMVKKQCPDGCAEGLQNLTEVEKENLLNLDDLSRIGDVDLGICPNCKKSLILNNIYADQYDENGYMPDWLFYKKWLQGTINKKIVILELGVGLEYPSVVRWPFEKIAFFNQKAEFFRVNENLYQLSEELAGKGTAIAQNAIDWLNDM